MPFTIANKTGIYEFVLAELNASTAYAATTDDDKFTDGQIAEAVYQADERYFVAIAETKGHWARPDIMNWSADVTAYLDEVAAHTGELGDVRIKYVSTDTGYQLANPLPREEIEIIRRNTDSTFNAAHNASGTITAGYFDPEALNDGVCAFTGYAMQVRIAFYVRTASLQSPEAYSSAISAHALANLFATDGLDPQLASYNLGLANVFESLVRRGAKTLTQ